MGDDLTLVSRLWNNLFGSLLKTVFHGNLFDFDFNFVGSTLCFSQVWHVNEL